MLSVDSSGRFLRRDGQPWFLLADTAWELFHRLDLDQARQYLQTRAAQGFNSVLAVGIAEFGGLTETDAYGDLPFEGSDPGRPVAGYWDHLDRVLGVANEAGLTVGLLPTWGSYWHDDDVRIFGPAEAAGFGRWIAGRLGDRDLFWVLGGDRELDRPQDRPTVDGFAAGIREVVGADQLITFHPGSHGSSKDQLADADWLDFDLVQSGHLGWETPNYELIGDSYRSAPRRPVIEGEPNYEAHPVMGPGWIPVPGCTFTDRDLRRAGYHAVFAGSAGFVYGATGTYQMLPPGAADPIHGATVSWREALALPGAPQAGHLGRLFGDLGIDGWSPDPELIRGTPGILAARTMALSRDRRREILVYLPDDRPVRLAVSPGPSRMRCWDPRAGLWSEWVDEPAGDDDQQQALVVRGRFPDDGVLHLVAADDD